MVAENGIHATGGVELREDFFETVQLVTLLIDQVAGKDNQVCFLLIHQIDLPDFLASCLYVCPIVEEYGNRQILWED